MRINDTVRNVTGLAITCGDDGEGRPTLVITAVQRHQHHEHYSMTMVGEPGQGIDITWIGGDNDSTQ